MPAAMWTKDYLWPQTGADGLFKNRTGAIYKIPAGDLIVHTAVTTRAFNNTLRSGNSPRRLDAVYDIVVTAIHYEVTLTDTETGGPS